MKHLKLYEDFLFEEDLKRADIAKFFGDPTDISLKLDAARVKALLWIYKYQTEEEKQTNSTHVLNGVGFTGVDGEILSSFAKQVIDRGFLSEKQMVILRKKIKKYENQMVKIANFIQSGKGEKDPKIERVMELWLKNNVDKYKQMKLKFNESESVDSKEAAEHFLSTDTGKKYIELVDKMNKASEALLAAKTPAEADVKKKLVDAANKNEIAFRKAHILNDSNLKWWEVIDMAEEKLMK